jgi:RNA polymerase sigma-70 factor (ECF subfamily)
MPTLDFEFEPTLTAVRKGDQQALNRLIAMVRDRLRQKATGSIGGRLSRRADDSDQVQEATREVFQRLEDFRGHTEAEFIAWATVILKRWGPRLYRQETALGRSLDKEVYDAEDGGVSVSLLPSGYTPPVEKALRNELEAQLQQVMDRLTAEARQAWVWRSDGCSMEEIASRLSCDRRAVARYLDQARIEVEKVCGKNS